MKHILIIHGTGIATTAIPGTVWASSYVPGDLIPNGDALLILARIMEDPGANIREVPAWDNSPLMPGVVAAIHPSFHDIYGRIQQGDVCTTIVLRQPNIWTAIMLKEHATLRPEDSGKLPYSTDYLNGRAWSRVAETILALAKTVHVIMLAPTRSDGDPDIPAVLHEVADLVLHYQDGKVYSKDLPEVSLADLLGVPTVQSIADVPEQAKPTPKPTPRRLPPPRGVTR